MVENHGINKLAIWLCPQCCCCWCFNTHTRLYWPLPLPYLLPILSLCFISSSPLSSYFYFLQSAMSKAGFCFISLKFTLIWPDIQHKLLFSCCHKQEMLLLLLYETSPTTTRTSSICSSLTHNALYSPF